MSAAGDSAQQSTSSGGLPSIERLDGSSNYSNWKFDMECVLVHDELWNYIIAEPDVADANAVKRDQKARAKICLMINKNCKVHVKNAKTAKQAWDALRSAYEDKGINNKCRLLSRLVSIKLEQFASVQEYVTEVMQVSQQLNDLGKEIDDELLATLMLQGLTEEFMPMRLALENTTTTLTTDHVKTKLLQLTSYRSESNQSEAALTSRSKRRPNTTQKKCIPPSQKTTKCFICDSVLHKARDCPDNPRKKATAHATMHTAVHAAADTVDDGALHSAMATSTSSSRYEFIVDTGASEHMTYNREWLKNYVKHNKIEISCADGGKVYGIGKGDVVSKDGRNVCVTGAMYVPDLAVNLLSVSTLVKRGRVVVFSKAGCEIYDSNDCVVKGKVTVRCMEERGVYKLKHYPQCTAPEAALATDVHNGESLELWHRRMGHLGVRNLKLMRDKLANGVSFQDSNNRLECIACLLGKQTRQPFPKQKASRAKDVLELVHSDICGPMSVESFTGFKYFMTFIDDKTRKTFMYALRRKSEAVEKLKEFKVLVETQTGKKLKAIRTDNGKEYVNKEMEQFTKENGIVHQLTVEYTPQMNPCAERANRTICEKSRSMLQEAGLDERFWAEAVRHAVYLKNRSPTIAVHNMTPEEAWTGKKTDVSHIKVFGCKAFMHIPDQKRKKWDPKSKELIHVGYEENTKAYRLVDPVTHNVHRARDVVFFENTPAGNQGKKPLRSSVVPITDVLSDEAPSIQPSTSVEPVAATGVEPPLQGEGGDGERGSPQSEDEEWATSDERGQSDVEETSHNDEISGRRYPLRVRKPKQFPDFVAYQAANVLQDPLTVQDALSREDKAKWKVAIEEELEALKKNKTWTLVKPPRSCNIVDSKWIFRIKEEVGGKTRYKARLVARGFSQRRGVDYFETFAPVVRHSSLRVLIALAAKMDLKIDQMDVKTAFLNGNLSEVVYMKQPEGFQVKGKEDHVCLLQKALYGLKQAPRAWNTRLHSELLRLKFKRSENEPCVYMRAQDGKLIIVAIYVDDLLIFWNNEQEMLSLKKELKLIFEMKDLGRAELMLGIHIDQGPNGIKLHQEKYVDKLLKAFNMENCKPVMTPAVPGQRLEKVPSDKKLDEKIPYRSLIGSLMYLAVCTRPDIAHVVNYLSQFNECYSEQHWIAAKRVLRYLKGTKKLGLMYSREKRQEMVEGYADADYAGDSDRRSYSGIVFLIQGGAVSWSSTKQRTVALSTAEAEYVSMSEAAKEAVFLRRFVSELTGKEYQGALTVFSDSQSAIAIAYNPVHHQRTKHVDVRYHFVRNAVEAEDIRLEYRETERMVADILTKPLPRGKFEWCVESMGLCV